MRFEKYTAFGNHFVIFPDPVDEQEHPAIARRAADPVAGVGADGVIFLYTIYGAYIARFYEPDGSEFLTCGSGLGCIAHHLYRERGLAEVEIAVEAPSQTPTWARVSYDPRTGTSGVKLAWHPARIESFVANGFARIHGPLIDFESYGPLGASGSIVYTGEPHMVVFGPEAAVDNAMDDGRAIAAFGQQLNHDPHAFPQGMNLTFARVAPSGAIETRTFERGLLRETLSCGTGALAVARIAASRGLAPRERVRIHPRLARAHDRFRDAELVIDDPLGEATLHTRAQCVFTGHLAIEP